MPSQPFLKANGLNTQPNQLEVQEGSLIQAENIVISRDNVIEPRRGFKQYGTSFGSSTDRAKQLMEYRGRILRHFQSTLQFDTEVLNTSDQSTFSSFSGSFSEVASGLRIKSIEANKNFYFTTSDGIKKISAASASDLSTSSGYITSAGGLKALDIDTRLNVTYGSSTGFLPVDSAVAYRVVWGQKDANNNLILGAPSSRSEIYNSVLDMTVRDEMTLLYALDQLNTSGSRYTDGNYVNTLGVDITSSTSDVRDSLIALCEKLDKEQGQLFSSAQITSAAISGGVCTVTVSANIGIFGKISVGDKIFLSGFTPGTSGTLNGVQTVSAITATTFSFETTATGAVSLSSEYVESGWFRGITEPAAPSTPATHDQDAALQTYLQSIITELQTVRNLKEVANNDAVASQQPLEIVSAAVAGGTTLTITFDAAGDARDQFIVGDIIFLDGTWTAAGAENISGIQTVASVAATTITCTLATSVTNGAVTIATNSTVDEVIRFSNALQTSYIDDLDITTTATVYVDVTIPPNATTDYFYQIYRSGIVTATGTDVLNDLIPNDEMKLVYEAFPTSAEISARFLTVLDIVPENFIQGTTNLYTNEISGEGILQSNDVPPLCKDIASFKNHTWFANTSTKQRKELFLLGVTKILEDYDAGYNPSLFIGNASTNNEYRFVKGVQEVTSITTVAGSALAASGTASYFTINGGNNTNAYYVWYKIGTATDPAIANKTGIQVYALAGDTSTQIAEKTRYKLNTVVDDFTATSNINVITVTNVVEGPCTNAAAGTSGFTISVTTPGAGEDAANKMVLLSNLTSPSLAVDATARSLVRVINKTSTDLTNAFYLSGINDTPGNILLEAKALSTSTIYVLANRVNTGSSFNPNLEPSVVGITNTAANPTVVTATAHGLSDGQQVVITGSNSTPSINGVYTISNATANTFTIPVNVSNPGTAGAIIGASVSETTDNESKPNRVYYSKYQQPEAVPLLNYLDVGSENKPIYRIFALRDSLFVFKEDGIFRISGETTPFNLALFDGTAKLIVTDSLGTSDNQIYAWLESGINVISESGVRLISRPIENILRPITTTEYASFPTASWGIGYESDNSYFIFTVSDPTDTVATTCYRYSTLTNTWTKVTKTNTCGIVKSTDDLFYLGDGEDNMLEVERKNYTRTDYADKQYSRSLTAGNYFENGASLRLDSVANVEVGDVLEQIQTIPIYTYNQLLKKLDLDPQVGDNNYYTTLVASGGVNMRTKLEQLAAKLDSDTGVSNIKTFTSSDVDTGTEVITINSHGFTNGQPVKFSTTGTLPGGLDSTNFFYIISATTNTFQVSTTEGGSAVNLTSGGSGTHTIKHSQYSALIISRSSYAITSNSAANPTIITSTNHGLQTGRYIAIASNTGSSPSINSNYQVTRLSANTFSIPVNVVTAGTGGAFTTLINDFDDIKVCYNLIITALNDDSGAAFTNYQLINTDTSMEAIVTDVNTSTGVIELNIELPFILGPITLFKHIPTELTYTPITMGDPVGMKHLSEATVMFQNKTFTSAELAFSTDLLPEFQRIPFNGLGNGIFGHETFGSGYFGGNSHSAPFRTYIPRQCQRCRFINVRFTHGTAREKYSIYGISLTGRVGLSSRAYR